MSNAIGTNRFVMLLFAVVASLALTLSGCGATSGDSGHGGKPNAPAGQNDKYFGHMEVGEDTEDNIPDGRTLQGPELAPYASYSYGNRARPSDVKHNATDAYECPAMDALYDSKWESNIRVLEGAGGDDSAGYEVKTVCEISIDKLDAEIYPDSDLFADIDLSDRYENESLGGTLYEAYDSDDMYYKIFVPSYLLVNEYGSAGVFTGDYLFYYQKDDYGNGELYRNLTPEEARNVFYPGE